MAAVTKASLVRSYLLEIATRGRETFVATTLAWLEEAARHGEVAATSAGDESTTMRLSPAPIDLRLEAAREAVARYDRGERGPRGENALIRFAGGQAGV